jgi:hypothetical protein
MIVYAEFPENRHDLIRATRHKGARVSGPFEPRDIQREDQELATSYFAQPPL